MWAVGTGNLVLVVFFWGDFLNMALGLLLKFEIIQMITMHYIVAQVKIDIHRTIPLEKQTDTYVHI